MPLVRPIARLLPLLVAALLLPAAAGAQAPLFTVEKVEVDTTADTATAARRQGLDQAHKTAFDRLLERLVPRSDLNQVPDLSAERIAQFTRDFEVFNERTSDVRYLAEVTFRFQPDSVRRFLRENAIPFAQTRSKTVVVLPIWGSGSDARLWDNPNPWREAWADRAEQVGLVPLTVPLGDLGDIRAVGAQQALNRDRAALQAIAERYGANDVIVTQARLAGDPEAHTASMQVITARVGTPNMERTLVDNVQQQRDEPLDKMLARAADRVAVDVEETWKRANLIDFEQQNRLRVEVPLDGLDRWVEVRRRLGEIARISGTEVQALARTTARLEIGYYGSRDQLTLALSQQDLVLEPASGDGPRSETAGSETAGSGAGDNGTADTGAGDWRLRPAGMAADTAGSADTGDDAAPAIRSDALAEPRRERAGEGDRPPSDAQ